MKRLILAVVFVLGSAGDGLLQARGIGTRDSATVVIDTGDCAGGFNVSVGSSTTVLISSSAANEKKVWRIRTFQVTDSPYNVWMGTYTPLTWGSGAGWFVYGSTGSYSTRSQAAYYGVLDPAAGSGTATIQGPFEYQCGEVPK